MKDVSLEQIAYSLEEHKILLKMLGYKLSVNNGTVPLHEELSIYRDNQLVGSLTHKDKNMYWLKEKKEILANENINNMSFSQIPKYNKKPVFHLVLDDDIFRVSCYNIFNKNYIAIENKKIKIKKFKDYIKIEVKDIDNRFTVLYPNRIDTNENYTKIVNKIVGFDVISNIESYYSNNKIKVKK